MHKTKYLCLFLLSLFLFGSKAIAQCPNGTALYFTSQSEIDDFLVNYPNCTDHDLNVFATGTDITNLNGLQNLTSLGTDLRLENTSLVDLSGLDNLTTMGGEIYIGYNDLLVNLNGLGSLTTVGENFTLRNNDALESVDGVENLSSLGGYLSFNYNSSLTNLNGLQSLTSVGSFFLITYADVLTNLNGLESLTSIGTNLGIDNNSSLLTLSGLDNLASIGLTMGITSNASLLNLNGLNSLTSIGRAAEISDNISLLSISGLENLSIVDEEMNIKNNGPLESLEGLNNLTSIGGYLTIQNNDELETLNGLNSLTSIGGNFFIIGNDGLTTLGGLDNLTTIDGNVSLSYNTSLSVCSVPAICEYLETPSSNIFLLDNATGCNDTTEILYNCGELGQVSLQCYYDQNENGLWEAGEPNLSFINATIQPAAVTLYGNPFGNGIKYLPFGDYTVTLNENALGNWDLTSGITSFDISLDIVSNSDTVYFGFYPNGTFSAISPLAVNGVPRCNEHVLFEPLVQNNGTTTATGTLWFKMNQDILDVNFIDLPDTIVGTDRFGWFFTDLLPQQVFKKEIEVQLPGPPNVPPGSILTFETAAQYSDELNTNFLTNNAHRVELQCAYDPNDKLVQPVYPENYALIGEELIYTVRFQNTGNAEAYNVLIKDELDPSLDLSTFKYITSSHDSVLSTFMDGNMLNFEFTDIFLPDSTTDFDASQGYVMYSIRAIETIADFTTIENTAGIFFDLNPPVITNTTTNTMVESFDADEDGFEVWLDCDDHNPLVNTASEEIVYNGIDDDCDESTPDDDLDNDGFLLADDCDDSNALVNPAASEIPFNDLDDDCDETTLDADGDQDGFAVADDCDDNNALINPAASEIPYNGLDDDCDETTLDDDLDQDGFGIDEDCDDENPLVNLDATEIPNNGIDEDCDGEDLLIGTQDLLTIKPQIFPNPTTGLLQITFSEMTTGNYELRNLTGKLMLENRLGEETTVDLSELPQGVYLLLLKTEEGVWTERVVRM